MVGVKLMNHFKDDKNQVFAFDDKQVTSGLAAGMTPISEAEKNTLLAPTDAQLKEKRKAEILSRLTEIDIQSLRPLRAIQQSKATDQDTQKLTALDAEAVQLRTELAGL